MGTSDAKPVSDPLRSTIKSGDRAFISRTIVASDAAEAGLSTRSFKYLPIGTLFFCLQRSSYVGPDTSAAGFICLKKLDGDGNCECYLVPIEDLMKKKNFKPQPLPGQTARIIDLEALVTTFDDYITRRPP